MLVGRLRNAGGPRRTDSVFKGRAAADGATFHRRVGTRRRGRADEHVTLDMAPATSLANVLTRQNHMPYLFFYTGNGRTCPDMPAHLCQPTSLLGPLALRRHTIKDVPQHRLIIISSATPEETASWTVNLRDWRL